MSLQYLDTLRAIGESPATKYVFPPEFTNFLRPFAGMFGGDGGDGGPGASGSSRKSVGVEAEGEHRTP
jgi:hypothetical protein